MTTLPSLFVDERRGECERGREGRWRGMRECQRKCKRRGRKCEIKNKRERLGGGERGDEGDKQSQTIRREVRMDRERERKRKTIDITEMDEHFASYFMKNFLRLYKIKVKLLSHLEDPRQRPHRVMSC